MSDASISRIENLPGEIFLAIFQYLPHFSLCRAWTGLNYHIDSLLHSARSQAYITSPKTSHEYAEYLRKWSKIVVAVEDRRDQWTALSSNYARFEPIDLQPFVNLRRFSQREDPAGQVNQIRCKDFPHLACLHFGDYSSSSYAYSRILFEEQFPFLTSVSGVFFNGTIGDNTTTNTIICRLVVCGDIGRNSCASLINLIKRLPNLTTLRIKCLDFEKASPPPLITTEIRHLSMWTEPENIEEIEYLLQIGPIQRFSLQIGSEGIWHGEPKSFNFVRLSQILNNCPTLKHVELRVWLHREQFDIEQLRQLSPWFATLGLKYGYQERKSLQTHQYQFKDEHLRF